MRKVSTSLFALVLICFVLPFVTVSCDNRPVFQLTGLQLTLGTTITTPEKSQKIPPDGRALLAFTVGAAGLGTSIVLKKRRMVPAGLAAIGAYMLLSLKAGFDKELLQQGAGFSVECNSGYWGSFIFFISAAILNGWAFFKARFGKLFAD